MKDDGCIIKLKNVSKFYYSKGVIASGFTKLNLEFHMGEFVAITGESGSGKSTLLNVISGLDSYEEGEMYINGMETSHYTEKDFEDYRRKYIGNIFQNFNLVNSYTVYQNIELVLLLNGASKSKIKDNVLDLIKKVGLYKFRNTKVSKLSGGQKQRVAIARALAKDTPMIIADEPTGNLDSKSAKEIVKLLSEVAKDKLVIIVTHNYDQVEEYVTRKIKMHDGKVLEDKVLKKTSSNFDKDAVSYKNITFLNRLRLGIRNTFNVVPKFLLVMLVYLFLSTSIISVYASLQETKKSDSNYSSYNMVFSRPDLERIVITKEDGTSFTDEDYASIKEISNVKKIVKNDLLIDTEVYITDNENMWSYGYIDDYANFSDNLDYGRMPENDTEIIVYTNDYYFNEKPEEYLNKKVILYNDYSSQNFGTYTIVGIKKYVDTDDGSLDYYNYYNTFYVGSSVIDKLAYSINQSYSTTYVTFLGKKHAISSWGQEYKIEPSERAPRGEAVILEDFNYSCPNENCHWQPVTIYVENKNFTSERVSYVSFYYNSKNYTYYFGNNRSFDEVEGIILIHPDDYKALFDKGIYQSSVYADSLDNVDGVKAALENAGYKALAMKDTRTSNEMNKIMTLIITIVMVVLIISVFFICYFVLTIILKSRNTYFATIRMLGANNTVARQLLTIELLAASTLSYIIVMFVAYIFRNTDTEVDFIKSINTYLTTGDYVLLFVIIFVMSYLISQKYARKLFKKSAMSTIREGGL